MIRLKDLLFESPASEKAKKLGYTHIGGGIYADKSGKAVARSKGGELVPYRRAEKSPGGRKQGDASALSSEQEFTAAGLVNQFIATEGNAHKSGDGGTGSGMSKEDFMAWLRDDEQSAMETSEIVILGDIIENEIIPGEELKIWGIVDEDPEDSGGKIANKTMNETEFKAQYARNLFIGATVPSYYIEHDKSLNAQSSKLYKDSRDLNYKQDNETSKRGAQQIKEWRSKIPVVEQAELLGYCWEWQIDDQYKVKEERKRKRNARLNAITKDGDTGPATTTLVNGQMDRGMAINTWQLKDFLENFQVGENTVMPPSGFTARSRYAHIYSSASNAMKKCGVHLRLHANNTAGEVVGLNLSGFSELDGIIQRHTYRDELIREYQKLGRHDNLFKESGMDGILTNEDWFPLHQGEAEVIRPGWVGQKTMKVEKHVFITKRAPRRYGYGEPQGPYEVAVKYVIDMVDTGEVPPDQIQEVKEVSRKALALLKHYTNGTVKNKKKKKVKKESMMPTLKQLLYELTPSQEAKKLGLKHTSFGRYADSSGNIVAMSRNGKLVRLTDKKDKPKRKSAKKTDNALNGGDGGTGSGMDMNKFLSSQVSGLTPFAAIEGRPAVKGEVVKIWQLAGSIRDADEQRLAYEMRFEDVYKVSEVTRILAKHEIDKTSVEGNALPGSIERAEITNKIKTKWKKVADDFRQRQMRQEQQGVANAKRQSKSRKKWDLGDQVEMLAVQGDWQYNPQYQEGSPEDRRQRNEFINGLFKKYDIEKVKADGLYRGMSIPVKDFDNFIANFDVGSSVVLPPSGFSPINRIGATFAQADPLRPPSRYSDERDSRIAVRIKIEPSNPDERGIGELTGLHLSQLAERGGYTTHIEQEINNTALRRRHELSKKLGPDPDGSTPEEIERRRGRIHGQAEIDVNPMRRKLYHYDSRVGFSFDDEIEVIVPGTVAHEVVSVTRHLVTKEDYDLDHKRASNSYLDAPTVEYEIVLRQIGDAEEGQIMEGLRSKNPKKILRKYFNSGVAGKRKPKKKKRK